MRSLAFDATASAQATRAALSAVRLLWGVSVNADRSWLGPHPTVYAGLILSTQRTWL